MDLFVGTPYEMESGVDVPKTEFLKFLLSKYTATSHLGRMAKEVGGNRNSSANVFQLLNENRMLNFESDVSADLSKLQLPSATFPPETKAKAKLHKCLSQPDLGPAFGTRTHYTASGPVRVPPSMYLPAALMKPTSPKDQFHTSTDSSSPRPLEGRYHTDPSYNSSGILKSFKHEFSLFGSASQVRKKSLSAPTSPRRASSPDLAHDILLMRQIDESRRLSNVQEEPVPRRDSTVALPEAASVEPASKPQFEESKMPAPVAAKDTIDGVVTSSKQKPLTKSVMDWFTTPQPKVSKVNRQEFNAISPTSF